MPQTVIKTVAANQLKAGDRLATTDQAIDRVEIKTKWTTIFTPEGGKLRVENLTPFQIKVEQKTEEEKAAEIAEFIEARLRNARAISRTNLAKIAEKITKALATGSPFAVSNWDFATLASTQAMEDLWTRVDTLEERVAAGTVDPMTFIEIVEKIKDRCREDLLSFRANSRSSSTMSNAVEDAQLDAKRQFISTWW